MGRTPCSVHTCQKTSDDFVANPSSILDAMLLLDFNLSKGVEYLLPLRTGSPPAQYHGKYPAAL